MWRAASLALIFFSLHKVCCRLLVSFFMYATVYYTRVNQCDCNVGNQAGGHRGITAVWRGVILATYIETRKICLCGCVIGDRRCLYSNPVTCPPPPKKKREEIWSWGGGRKRSRDWTQLLTFDCVSAHSNPPLPPLGALPWQRGSRQAQKLIKETRCILTWI